MAEEVKKEGGMIAVILIRSQIGATQGVKDTLRMLNLSSKNGCSLVKNTPVHVGMLKKVKDFVTWGEVDDATVAELKTKRGKTGKNKKGEKVEKPFYNLHPPRGGFERKGIKKTFKEGGALGYRGAKMNDLLKRMI